MSTDSIADVLAREAEAAERVEAEHRGPYVRSRSAPRDPSQVYSLRIPLRRLELIRRLAAQHHVTPAALLRTWVLERLSEEAPEDVQSGNAIPDGQREEAMALVRQLEATLRRSA